MKNNKNMVVLLAIIMSIFGTTVGIVGAAPTIGTVTLTPENPTPESNVTFSVNVTGEEITVVHLIYKECNEELCYQNHNITMTKEGDTTYTTTITLEWDAATFITYHLAVNSSGTWTITENVDVNLSEIPGNGNNTNGNGDESPGFELVVLMGVIALIVIVMRRKRS